VKDFGADDVEKRQKIREGKMQKNSSIN